MTSSYDIIAEHIAHILWHIPYDIIVENIASEINVGRGEQGEK